MPCVICTYNERITRLKHESLYAAAFSQRVGILCSVNYKYKTKVCSLGSLIVLLFIILSVLTPFFIIHHAGGFWLKNRLHVESSNVLFGYKYLMLAEKDDDVNPVICSTFATYKGNEISDDCVLVKVQEIDTNNDGKKDILKFEAQFYTDRPIKSLKLLLFFSFKLEQLFEAVIESIAVFDYSFIQESQGIEFFGDLELYQKGPLGREGLYEVYNHSIKLGDQSLTEILMDNANRKFAARISNLQAICKTGYSSTKETVVYGQLFYRDHLIYYYPGIWEELKWAWVQYLSTLLVFAYIAKHTLIFLFSNCYLNAYTVIPWKNKS